MLFHWKQHERKVHNGNYNPNQTYYVIRPSSADEGLLSLYFTTMEEVMWAEEKGYIPYVDFSNSTTQYWVEREINGTKNMWEYYFNQPAGIEDDEIREGKNIILSGWKFFKTNEYLDIRSIEYMRDPAVKKVMQTKCDVKPYIKELVKRKNVSFLKEKKY